MARLVGSDDSSVANMFSNLDISWLQKSGKFLRADFRQVILADVKAHNIPIKRLSSGIAHMPAGFEITRQSGQPRAEQSRLTNVGWQCCFDDLAIRIAIELHAMFGHIEMFFRQVDLLECRFGFIEWN